MGKNNRFRHRKPQRPASDYKPPYSDDVLNMSVEGLNLSVETLDVLQKGGIKTLGDILSRRKNDMYKVQNFNKKRLFEVSNAIAPLGVDFRPDEPKVQDGKQEPAQRKENGREREDRLDGNRGKDRSRDDRRKDAPRDDRQNAKPHREEMRPAEDRRRAEQENADRRDFGKNKQQGGKDRQNGREKQDNSVDFSKIFPREKLVHSPRIEMKKDRFTKFQRAGRWGYKDETGKEVIPPIYTEALNFKEDMAAVEMNGLFGFINRENVLVIPYKYDTAGSFSEGWANVSLGEKCGYVDQTGKETVPFIYDAATPFTGEGYGRVKKDGRWGNITKDGEVSWQ